jgi:hypothetical protein
LFSQKRGEDMGNRIVLLLVIVVSLLFFLAGCLPGDGTNTQDKPAGFLWGIWHGWLAPVSLIAHFFDKEIRIYEVNNSGWLYDFGFYISIIAGFGGLSLSRKKKDK